MNALSRITPAIAASISRLMVWYCSCRSANGTGIDRLPLFARQQPARRIARIGAGSGNILGYHGSSSDDDIIGNSDGHDGGIGADRHAVSDHGLAPKLLSSTRRAASGKSVVNEYDA